GRSRACARSADLLPFEAGVGAYRLDDLSRCRVGRAGVEGRLGVVLEAELDRLRDLRAGDLGGERERHVDAGGDAGAGGVLAVEDDPLLHDLDAERAQLLERLPVAG